MLLCVCMLCLLLSAPRCEVQWSLGLWELRAAHRDIFHTRVAQYSLFVLKLLLNTNWGRMIIFCINGDLLNSIDVTVEVITGAVAVIDYRASLLAVVAAGIGFVAEKTNNRYINMKISQLTFLTVFLQLCTLEYWVPWFFWFGDRKEIWSVKNPIPAVPKMCCVGDFWGTQPNLVCSRKKN